MFRRRMLGVAAVIVTPLSSTIALGSPSTSTWPSPGNADALCTAGATLAGIVATGSTQNDSVEVRDIVGNLLASVSRAQIQALLPWMNLNASVNGPAGLAFSESGRLLFIAVTDTTIPGDGLGSDAVLRLDIDTGQLTVFCRAELGGPDAARPRVALAHYKGRLYVGSTGTVQVYRAQMNDTTGTALFAATVSPGQYTTGLTLDHTLSYLLASTDTQVFRAPVSTANGLTFSLLGSASNIRSIALCDHYGGLSNPGLYILSSTSASANAQVYFATLTQARASATFAPTLYTTASANRHDLAATAEGKLLLGADTSAELLRDTADYRLSYTNWLTNEFNQVVSFGRGLISPDGEPAGWVIDADVTPSASRFHPASPDAAAWTVFLLLMSDEISKRTTGQPDPNAQAQVGAVLQRYAGDAPDGIRPLRSADGIYWHWIDPATGNAKAGWGDSYATMSTMKIVLAAARAAAYYPADPDIRRYARHIICGVHNWDAYFNPANFQPYQYQLYLLALASGGPDPFTGSSAFNEGILFADAAANYGGAYSDASYAYWLNWPILPSATLLTSRPVKGGSTNNFQAAFVSLYPLLLLQPYRSNANWQAQIRNLRASNAAWTDDNGPQYFTVFSAGTTPSGYNADSLSGHPSDITTFTSLEAFCAGDGASPGRHVEGGAAYEAYRNNARETFKTGASILYRRSNTTRTFLPNSAGMPDVALGGLGLAELISPGVVAQVLTAPYPSCSYCPSDVDDGSGLGIPDSGTDINDLLFFLAQYEAGAHPADLDDGSGSGTPDGGVDINDLLFFLAHYEAGC